LSLLFLTSCGLSIYQLLLVIINVLWSKYMYIYQRLLVYQVVWAHCDLHNLN
jgi:hypothetical protein